MESTGQRVSAFLLELEEELSAKDREITELRDKLAQKSAEVPEGLGTLIRQLEEQLKNSRRILSALEPANPDPPAPVPPPISEEERAESFREKQALQSEIRDLRALLEAERESHGEHVARLINELETVRETKPVQDGAVRLREQMDSEREAHESEKAVLKAELETSRETVAALEAALIEQRGALQRIEAKFSLYAAAVSKLSQHPELKRPKLLESSKQLPRPPQNNAYSIR